MTKTILVVCLTCAAIVSTSCMRGGSNTNTPMAEPQIRSEARETGREFLVNDEPETPGYGLYSYLLFGSPPTETTRERYLKAIAAYLNITKISDIEKYRSPCELNITYLPINESPMPNATAEWLLEHYDYARARILLQPLPGTHRVGPYIVSTYKPLSSTKELSGQYLYQDLSSCPPEIVVLWVKEFLSQVEQKRFWEERTAMQCVIRLRESIAIAAAGYPKVRDAVSELIKWNK